MPFSHFPDLSVNIQLTEWYRCHLVYIIFTGYKGSLQFPLSPGQIVPDLYVVVTVVLVTGRQIEAVHFDLDLGFFRSLKDMGCQTVVSEFGCSLNPLEAIAHLDVDLVKLDESFTEELTDSDNVEELQKMIKALNEAGTQIIVPGIETAEEMTPIWQFGAHFIQGNYMQPATERMDFDFGSDG